MDKKDKAFESIGSAFNDAPIENSATHVAIFLGVFFAVVIALLYFAQTRYRWRARFLYLKKRIKGEAVSKDRVAKTLEIVIQLPYRDQPYRTKIQNLSPNGMFVRMNPPLMVGESFRFLLNLDNETKINAWAEVRWAQQNRTPYTPPGIGCKFFHLQEEDRQKIQKLLRRKL